ncbi:MAG: hypothetical protein AMS24_02900 [Chlamydiae bacterium SM23_39]|nr:MAG: hypothetical protein AMS24_02900 [Chlamydiae bacterium SM23_39]
MKKPVCKVRFYLGQVSPCDFFKAFGKNFPRFFEVTFWYCVNETKKIFCKKNENIPKPSEDQNIITKIKNDTVNTFKGAQKIIKFTKTVGELTQ